MSDAAWTFVVLGVAVAAFVWNRVSPSLVAVVTALALYGLGIVDARTAVAGFGDTVVVFIAALFVVSEGLEASGVTAWAGQQLLARVGTQRARLLVALMCLAALMSALVTPNGAAAALLPVMVLAAHRSGIVASQLAIPLAYAASAGALLTLSGSIVNVIVSEALDVRTGSGFGFFEFALVGVPLVAVTVAVAWWLGPRLLPRRNPSSLPADLSGHLDTLVDHYDLVEGFFRLVARPGSRAVGTALASVTLPEGVRFVGVQDDRGRSRGRDRTLAADDVVVLGGPATEVFRLAAQHGLAVVDEPLNRRTREALLGPTEGLAEVVVPPRSTLVGQTRFPGFEHDAVRILAIRRFGRDIGLAQTTIQEGDAMLVHGSWRAVEAMSRSDEVLVVDSPELVRRQNVPLGPAAWRALTVLGVTVVLLASGVVSPAVAGLVGAIGMVLTRVLRTEQAFRAVSWQTVVLIGALIPLSVAIQQSGAADMVAREIVGLVPSGQPRLLLVALFVLTALLGQFVSNAATVLVVTPVAISAAVEKGVALEPVLMLVAVAGAASFLTPIATPANMMVMAPGGYRFGDYWRLGIVTTLLWLVVGVGLVPVFWPLH